MNVGYDPFQEFRFRRNPLFGILWSLGTVVWSLGLVLKITKDIGSLSVWFFIPVIIIFIVNTLWSFTAPYVLIKAGTITVRQGVLNVKTFQLSDVDSIKQKGPATHLLFTSKKKVVISGWSLERWQREKLRETLNVLRKAEAHSESS